MMPDSANRDAKIAEIAAMVADGRTDDAVRLSGEYLALADDIWRRAYNAAADDAPALLTDVLVLGYVHADTLFRAGACADAYSTALMLMMVAVTGDGVAANPDAMLALCVIALSSFQQILPSMIPDDFTRDHTIPVLRYLGSMCLVFYRATQQQGLTVWHKRAYMHLESLDGMGLIDADPIEVNGTRETAMRPFNIVGDILAHSRALEILEN